MQLASVLKWVAEVIPMGGPKRFGKPLRHSNKNEHQTLDFRGHFGTEQEKKNVVVLSTPMV